ncbi:MAG: hypothetical protein R2881_10620 [Eubacteriales bacterium]
MWRCRFDLEKVRLGIAANINPNWLGMLATAAAAFCLVLAVKECALAFIDPDISARCRTSKSAKAMVLAALLLVVILLILYLKRWWLKLLALLSVCRGVLFLDISGKQHQ